MLEVLIEPSRDFGTFLVGSDRITNRKGEAEVESSEVLPMSTSPAPSAAERDPSPQAFNLQRAAVILGITKNHLRRLTRGGRIQSIRAGRRILYTQQSIQEFLASGCEPVPATKP